MRTHVYFPNLNGLRFIAAFLVILSHLEWLKLTEGMENYSTAPFIRNLGSLGVSLFFVLSGFLITYLLLQEKKSTGDISIRDFYIRRILRIWPVYYLTVILSFFILPNCISIKGFELTMFDNTYWSKLTFFSFLMANVAYAMYSMVPFASQLWSVGVEEQFYLIWPVINKKFKKSFAKILAGIIVLIVSVRIILGMPVTGTITAYSTEIHILQNFFEHFRIQDMSIGALGALALFHKKDQVLGFIFSKPIEILNLTLAVIATFTGLHFGLLNEEIYACFFLVIILNASSNPNTILNLEGSLFRFLGKISYGLYVYQIIAIKIGLLITFSYFGFQNNFVGNLVYYAASIILTIGFAGASWFLMEKNFLSLKKKYSSVLSN